MSYEEDIENQIYEDNHRLYEAEIENTVENYLHYLEESHDVKKKTLEKKTSEIYSIILLVYKYLDSGSSYSMIGYETLDNVLLDVTEDIEMSIFLSIHGKYRAANALLRRWLETAVTAIYFDCELKKHSQNIENYEKTLAEALEWLKESNSISFTGNGHVLDKLIDSNTDDFALQLLSESVYFDDSTLYLFSWDDIPGNDDERVIKFLKDEFKIEWAKTENISKIDDDKTIIISNKEKSLLLKLNDKKTKVNLRIDDGKTGEFTVKTENGKLNIYLTFNKYVKNIYGNLSKSVHYGGMDISLDNLYLDFSEYNRELFEKWYGNFNQINEICNILIFLKNPETITLIKEHKISIPTLESNQMIILKRILKSKA